MVGSNKWQMHVSGLQDVRVLVQEDEGDAIVWGERVELQRLTGMPRRTALRNRMSEVRGAGVQKYAVSTLHVVALRWMT